MANRQILLDEAQFIHDYVVGNEVPPNLMQVERLNHNKEEVIDIFLNFKYQGNSVTVRLRELKVPNPKQQRYFIAVYINSEWCDPWQNEDTCDLIHRAKLDMLRRYAPVAKNNSKI